ncbi:Transposon TX1 uncharacterized 149 kDa protein [Linum perenne]
MFLRGSRQPLISLQVEEGLLKQKAQIRGKTEGDQNTHFFHRSVDIKNSFNSVSQIMSPNGRVITDPDLIVVEFISYYKILLGTEDSSVVPPTVEALKVLLNNSSMILELNVTSLTLIPKISNPSQVRDFRPISCCNLFYKCVAKILASWMQLVPPDIISPSQSGFIKDRKIVDNVLLAQELVRTYSHSGISPHCTIKIDLMKAFDSVHWGYLFNMLAMGLISPIPKMKEV